MSRYRNCTTKNHHSQSSQPTSSTYLCHAHVEIHRLPHHSATYKKGHICVSLGVPDVVLLMSTVVSTQQHPDPQLYVSLSPGRNQERIESKALMPEQCHERGHPDRHGVITSEKSIKPASLLHQTTHVSGKSPTPSMKRPDATDTLADEPDQSECMRSA